MGCVRNETEMAGPQAAQNILGPWTGNANPMPRFRYASPLDWNFGHEALPQGDELLSQTLQARRQASSSACGQELLFASAVHHLHEQGLDDVTVDALAGSKLDNALVCREEAQLVPLCSKLLCDVPEGIQVGAADVQLNHVHTHERRKPNDPRLRVDWVVVILRLGSEPHVRMVAEEALVEGEQFLGDI